LRVVPGETASLTRHRQRRRLIQVSAARATLSRPIVACGELVSQAMGAGGGAWAALREDGELAHDAERTLAIACWAYEQGGEGWGACLDRARDGAVVRAEGTTPPPLQATCGGTGTRSWMPWQHESSARRGRATGSASSIRMKPPDSRGAPACRPDVSCQHVAQEITSHARDLMRNWRRLPLVRLWRIFLCIPSSSRPYSSGYVLLFWMLTIYSKSMSDNVPAHVLKELLEAFRNG